MFAPTGLVKSASLGGKASTGTPKHQYFQKLAEITSEVVEASQVEKKLGIHRDQSQGGKAKRS